MTAKHVPRVTFALSAGEISSGPWDRVTALLGDSAEFGTVVIDELPTTHNAPDESEQEGYRLNYRRRRESSYSVATIDLLNAFLRSKDFHECRYAALKLLNRKDLTGTFRLLDRETLLLAALADCFQILAEERPNLLVFAVTPHEFLYFVLWKVADWLGVKVLFFQPSSISPTMFARTGLDTVVSAPLAVTREFSGADSVIQIAREQLARLVNGDDPTYIQIQRDRDNALRGVAQLLRSVSQSFRWLFTDRFPESFDLTGHGHKQGLLSRGVKVFLTRSLQRTLKERINSIGERADEYQKYCVFALHYEPERTSLPEGLPFDYQGNALLAARAMIPADVALVVKEHYSQQTSALRGFLGRSPLFYDVVQSLPNTFLAPTGDRLTDLVERAECVLTLTGTVGIEAVLRGVPVGYFGAPWWAGLPGTCRVEQDTVFDNLISRDPPPSHEIFAFLKSLTLDVAIPGLAGVPADTVERRLGFLPVGLFEAEAEAIAHSIRFLVADSEG